MLFKTPFEAICKFFCTVKTKNYGEKAFHEQTGPLPCAKPPGQVRESDSKAVPETIPRGAGIPEAIQGIHGTAQGQFIG